MSPIPVGAAPVGPQAELLVTVSDLVSHQADREELLIPGDYTVVTTQGLTWYVSRAWPNGTRTITVKGATR
jgi:hypothetical protein